MSREKDTSQDDQNWEEPQDRRYYARPRPQPPRPRVPRNDPRRQTRNFREEEERLYRQAPQRPPNDYAEYEDYGDYERPVRRSGARVSPQSARRTQPARRSPWSTLLIGCIGGIVTVALVVGIGGYILLHALQVNIPGLGIGTSAFTDKQQTTPLNITSNITQLQVQNNAGNISISDGSNQSSAGTVSYVKKTRANSSSSAAAEFARMQVKVLPGNSTTCPQVSCLIVSATTPASSSDSIDLTIVLPAQNPTPQFNLNSKTQTGNISVENYNGLLNLTVDTGNINVSGGLLDAGSCLQARIGNITFAGTLETANAPTTNPCFGNTIAPPAPGASQPWFKFITGTGNLDVTLNTLSTKVILDAIINNPVKNSGQINSAYPITITRNTDGSVGYFGPLLAGTQPVAQLTLSVDTGNITVRKG